MPIQNIERRKEYLHEYRIAHRVEIAKFQKQYRATHKAKYIGLKVGYHQRLKTDVLTHYGLGQLKCVRCGEERIVCLSIDHINGSGAEHRREIGVKTSRRFYQWLRSNNYPEGYQTLCMNCQFVKRAENKECHGKQNS